MHRNHRRHIVPRGVLTERRARAHARAHARSVKVGESRASRRTFAAPPWLLSPRLTGKFAYPAPDFCLGHSLPFAYAISVSSCVRSIVRAPRPRDEHRADRRSVHGEAVATTTNSTGAHREVQHEGADTFAYPHSGRSDASSAVSYARFARPTSTCLGPRARPVRTPFPHSRAETPLAAAGSSAILTLSAIARASRVAAMSGGGRTKVPTDRGSEWRCLGGLGRSI